MKKREKPWGRVESKVQQIVLCRIKEERITFSITGKKNNQPRKERILVLQMSEVCAAL